MIKNFVFLFVLCCGNTVFAQCWSRGYSSCGNTFSQCDRGYSFPQYESSCNSCEVVQSSCNSCEVVQSSCNTCGVQSYSPQSQQTKSPPMQNGESTPYAPPEQPNSPQQNDGEVVPKFDLSYNVSSSVLMRVWVDDTGTYRRSGQLIGTIGNKVKIKTATGVMTVLMSRLSQKDKNYINQHNQFVKNE